MARLLRQGVWFEPVTSTALYESQYREVVLANAAALFPEYVVVRFEKTVESETGTSAPDLALIDRQYRLWWVGEVELSHHSLTDHVLPQVRTLAQAKYSTAEATYLYERNNDLEKDLLADMMKGSQPRVLVIVNALRAEWRPALAMVNARIVVVELFRSDRNEHILRLNGDYPDLPTDQISLCRLDPTIPRLLRVMSPGALPKPADDLIRIWYDGGLTIWQRFDSADKVWLVPVDANPLRARATYALMKSESGELQLTELEDEP